MTVFDQRGQQVTYQYNAAGDINFGAVQNKMDIVSQLEKLHGEVIRAGEAQALDEETTTDAEYQLKKAIQQAKKPEPDKKTILDHLNQATALIGGVTAAAGLVKGLVAAAEAVRAFF